MLRTPIVVAGVVLAAASWLGAEAAPVPASPDQVRPLLIGSTAPVGQLPDAGGQSFDLGQAFDAGPTVLVFYRAHW